MEAVFYVGCLFLTSTQTSKDAELRGNQPSDAQLEAETRFISTPDCFWTSTSTLFRHL